MKDKSNHPELERNGLSLDLEAISEDESLSCSLLKGGFVRG